MPSFEYTAIDRQGNRVQGQVQADTRDAAALSLTKTGLLVSRLEASGAPAPFPQPTMAKPSVGAAKVGPPPRLGSPAAAAVATASATPRASLKPVTGHTPQAKIRTKRGTDKDIYFLFSQLQSYARAGINPVESFSNLANSVPRKDYREALGAAADAAKEGRPISNVLERYVDLFPPNVVGMIRAAEHGGFFPEAYDLITDQAHSSHKLRIWFRWLLWVAVMVGICLPVLWMMMRAVVADWQVQDKTGGQASGWGTLFSSIGHEILWPGGPVILALLVGTWLFGNFWQSLPMREVRHRLVLSVPSVNKRARAESLSVFAWTMGMLSRVGMPPRTVWELSVDAVPNLEMRSRLAQTGTAMGEQTRLSEAMLKSKDLPEEYAPIVQTGEITGDLPGALIMASQSQLEEYKAGDQAVKARVGCWMVMFMVLGSLALFVIFYKMLIPAFMPE
jgi:type II secretory pathway component PulF